MIYEQTMNKEDTPILVSYSNGEKHYVMYRNKKKKIPTNGFKFLIKGAVIFLAYFLESIYIGLRGVMK